MKNRCTYHSNFGRKVRVWRDVLGRFIQPPKIVRNKLGQIVKWF